MENQTKQCLYEHIDKNGVRVVYRLVPLPDEIFVLPRLVLDKAHTINGQCIYCCDDDNTCICKE